MSDLITPAEPGYRVSAGQAMEFRIWAELIQQSRGALHVFLPLLDRGLDAVVHRMSDGKYIALQVKSRGELHGTKLQIVIPKDKLVDDDALIIAGTLIDDDLGSDLLVVDEGTFKRLASNLVFKGEEMFWIELNLGDPPDKWKPFVVRRQQLAARLMGSSAAAAEFPVAELGAAPIDRYTRWLGFVGEAEVIRQLARNPSLDLFRPYPDIELVEVLARHGVSRRFGGIQVKTGGVQDRPGHEAVVDIRKATFVSSPEAYVVVLAWLPEAQRLADECLLIPTDRLASVASDDGDVWHLKFHPHSPKPTLVDPYRMPLDDLGARVGELIG